jgi:tetratricopeptide (TPR) repeat protein
LYQLRSELNDLLKNESGEANYIENVRGKGYRFAYHVEVAASDWSEPFVDRTQQLLMLWKSYRTSKTTGLAIACVTGEEGEGKTSLVRRFLSDLREKESPVFIGCGACMASDGSTQGYGPWYTALSDLLSRYPRVRRVMQENAPTWLSDIEHDAGADRSSERRPPQLYRFLFALGDIQPIVIFLDNMHLDSGSAVDLVRFLADQMRPPKLFIILAYQERKLVRGSSITALIKKCSGPGILQPIRVSFLALQDVEEYVSVRFPNDSLPPEIAHILFDVTGGYPDFLVKAARWLETKGMLQLRDGKWIINTTLDEVRQGLPASINDMLRELLDGLEITDYRILQMAALSGEEFNAPVIARALDLDPIHVEETTSRLQKLPFFITSVDDKLLPDGNTAKHFRFRHFVQETIVQDMGMALRAAYSLKLAGALLHLYGSSRVEIYSQVSFLYALGGRRQDAIRYLRQAADYYIARHNFQDAAEVCRRALNIIQAMESLAGGLDELKCLNILGISIMSMGGYAAPELQKIYARAEEICHKLTVNDELATVLFGRWTYTIDVGNIKEAEVIANEMMRVAGLLRSPVREAMLMEAYYALGVSLLQLGRFKEAQDHLRVAYDSYRPEHAKFDIFSTLTDPRIRILCHLARGMCLCGNLDAALDLMLDTNSETQEMIDDPETRCYSLVFLADVYQFRREPANCRRIAGQAIELAVAEGIMQERAWAILVQSWAAALDNGTETTFREYEDQLNQYERLGCGVALTKFYALLAEAYLDQARLADGENALQKAKAFANKNGEYYYSAEIKRLEGELLIRQGNIADAVQCLLRAKAEAQEAGALLFQLRAEASLSRISADRNASSSAGT